MEAIDSDEHSSLLPQGKGIGKAEAYRTGDPQETPLPALLTDTDQHSSLLRYEINYGRIVTNTLAYYGTKQIKAFYCIGPSCS